MARNMGRYRYMRDRADRRRNSYGRDRAYPMEYDDNVSEYDSRYYTRGDGSRYSDERYYMDDERYREPRRTYEYEIDGRRNYRGDYAIGGIGRPREYNRRNRDYRDYRDYAEADMDEEYEEDLKKWISKLKKSDRFGLSKEQVIQKAKDMKVDFKEYDENEFYAIYLMHISDYPSVANEPHTYLAMAKAWLEDKDIKISPSEKVCRYMYEIAMAEEDD